MTTAPSLEQFMTTPTDPEEDLELPDPLTSIAHSLDRLLAIAEHHALEETAADQLREAHDDLDAKHAVLYDLVTEIEEIIKPSTSKLANNVREAIDRWRGVPEGGLVEVPATDPQVIEHGDPDDQDPGHPVAQPIGATPEQPADDASVFEWQYYARCLGHDVATVNAMNRSQIRTLLGIPQPS